MKTLHTAIEPLPASDLFGLRVIAPSAPKYAKHGYSGRGYIGVVTEETDTHAVVRFGNSGTRRFHKSHLSALKPNVQVDLPPNGKPDFKKDASGG
jgi:hypothetical protein